MSAGHALSPTLPETALRRVPVALAGATVLAQVAYPLVPGAAQHELTMVIVTLFAATSVSHALVWRGARWAARLLAVTALGGLVVESVGVALDVPFGAYAYTDTLRPQLFGVPWVIPLAWTMMAYPALVVARRIVGPSPAAVAGPLTAAAALATWDLFLDPQMIAAGHWVWEEAAVVPSFLGVPLTNFAGWFATALVMAAALWPTLTPPTGRGDGGPGDADRLPIAMYLWTWGGSVVAHAVFLGLPASALAGGVGMGAVVALLLRALRRERRAA
jgi:putative membrane protein